LIIQLKIKTQQRSLSMPKIGMKPLRRKQLITAAIQSIHEYGLADATVARIAHKAGVSTGIVHHYFDGKNDLLFATMRWLLEELRSEAVGRLKEAHGSKERIYAVVDASFDEKQFSTDVMAAWLALYGSAQTSDPLHRILHIYTNRLQSNLRHGLKQLMDEEDANLAAESTAALIDGLWLKAALAGGIADAGHPRRLVHRYIDMQIATHGPKQ
jgi:TetR/AcrR family transcriptional repressor of bet genes